MKRADAFAIEPGWQLLLLDIGLSPQLVLKHAQLPSDLFARQQAQLSIDDCFRLWISVETLSAQLPRPLPLLIGDSLSFEMFSPPLVAAGCSPNLNVALERIAQYKRLICPMRIEIQRDEQETRLRLRCEGYDLAMPTVFVATELVFFTQLARLATRQPIVPRRLCMPALPDTLDPYTSYFGRRIERGELPELAFAASDAARPFLTENPALWDFLEPNLNQRLSELQQSASWQQKVESVLIELLPSGESNVQSVANRLALSPRTLQRHLADEGLRFQHLLNATRERLAKRYLSQSPLAPGEIAFLLGFRDSNSFLRAFKTWTGATPGEFRRLDSNRTGAI
ncbi:helix-turn-helix transcriptional regulator [Pseudomarimonas arenosa]|uniref:AraC family transcriptional regulator ligand-binding domain-containing protein n=1 Tax=Pseudomarimonas arenosa TaxID=2774145 RepID=A0AAW3ZJK6_9GAMM|nr:AraC family transcriptional regulator [Pseudomarimonas arenosa]MBD8525635.1 AraC family transcriptional regulator ligand-binding domain-containing protein [Pseudomarimonas arenosa]